MVAILSTFRELERLRQIYLVLVRHGFGELAKRIGLGAKKERSKDHELAEAGPPSLTDEEREAEAAARAASSSPMAERVRLVAMDLGPSFVKLGQIASTRSDVLPGDWIRELKKLQDEVKPLPFEEIKAAVEGSLAAPLERFFESFDERPLAAASIGQVHRAVLRTDEGPRDVVVKVQRPGARETVARDVELLHRLARLVEQTVPESRTYSPVGLVEQFDRAITAELDFGLEADNAIRFRQNFHGSSSIRFPAVYKAASTKQVLTLEFLPGCKLSDAPRRGFSGPAIAKELVRLVIQMIFEDGFFHADPHPGNILVSGEPGAPVLGLVDLGMVGRLSPEARDRCIDVMVAAGRNDHVALADALYAMGTPTKKVDMRAFRAHVATISEKYLNRPLKEIDLAAMVADLTTGASKFGLEIPPDFLLMGKALMTLDGVAKELDPDLDVFTESKPYFIDLLRKRYSPERMGNEAWRALEKLSGAAYDVPQQTREVLDDLRLGRLRVTAVDPGMPLALDRLGRRIFSGLVIAAFVGAGAWLTANPKLEWFGVAFMVLAGLFFLLHAAADALRGRRARRARRE
jgi:ubiquinone biosynthesis protein